MATYAQNLITARDQIAARMVELTAELSPDHSDQGRSVQLGSYLAQLKDFAVTLQDLLQAAEGPILVKSRGRSVG